MKIPIVLASPILPLYLVGLLLCPEGAATFAAFKKVRSLQVH